MARCSWIDRYAWTSRWASASTRHRHRRPSAATEIRTAVVATALRIAARALDPDRAAVATSVTATNSSERDRPYKKPIPYKKKNIFQIIPCHDQRKS
jgi:hypothetical protein